MDAFVGKLPVEKRKKRICLIRHAKSKAQGSTRAERSKSLALLDAKLHRDGMKEMQGLGAQVAVDKKLGEVEIVLCSPLSRAIQTACLTFEKLDCKILLVPELSEFPVANRMSGYENTGRRCDVLAIDGEIRRLPKFQDIDFSLVNEFHAKYGHDWWVKNFDPIRNSSMIERVKKILLALPFERIAVVGHCCNLMALLGTYERIPNATPIWCKMKTLGDYVWLSRTQKVPLDWIAAVCKRRIKATQRKASASGNVWKTAYDIDKEDLGAEESREGISKKIPANKVVPC